MFNKLLKNINLGENENVGDRNNFPDLVEHNFRTYFY